MLELGLSKTLVIIHGAVSDQLDLGHTRDCLEVRVQDRLLGFASLVVAMTVVLRCGVEVLQ